MPEETQTDIKYLRGEIKDLGNVLNQFMGKQDGRFESLANTYVRKDLLDLNLSNITSDLKEIKSCQQQIATHIPMLETIKKERESVKNQVINIIGKIFFWLITAVIAIYAVSNNK